MQYYRGSEVQSFQRCKMQHQYNWVEGLVPRTQNKNLFFGNEFHIMLEQYNDRELSHDDIIHSMKVRIMETDHTMDMVSMNELINHLETTYSAYVNKWDKEDMLRRKIIGTEVNFRIQLTADFGYEGTIDNIFIEDDKLKIEDHKTVTSMEQYEKNSMLDRQISRYWWAVGYMCQTGKGEIRINEEEWAPFAEVFPELLGLRVEEFVYDLVSKNPPDAPKILKSGKLSTDKQQRTTSAAYWEAYLRSQEHVTYSEAEREKIGETYDILEAQDIRFWRRIAVTRSTSEAQFAMKDFVEAVKDLRGCSYRYMNVTTDCPSMCNFFGLCQAKANGENESMAKTIMYMKREDSNDVRY